MSQHRPKCHRGAASVRSAKASSGIPQMVSLSPCPSSTSSVCPQRFYNHQLPIRTSCDRIIERLELEGPLLVRVLALPSGLEVPRRELFIWGDILPPVGYSSADDQPSAFTDQHMRSKARGKTHVMRRRLGSACAICSDATTFMLRSISSISGSLSSSSD